MLKKVFQRFFQNKTAVLLLLALIVLISVRFLWIDRFPVGINHDEAEVVLGAKTYWKYGTDISLTPFPKSIFTNETSGGLSGLPSYLLTPLIGWARFSLLTIRLPFIVLNIASLAYLALIVWQFTNNKVLIFSTIFVGLINPWFFSYSRATTEAPFALFFILMGIYLLFKYQGKKILYSIIPFILAFYSYFGAKPAVVVLVPLLLFLHQRFFGKTNKKTYLLYLFTFLTVIGIYFISLGVSSGENTLSLRSSRELVFMNLDRFSTQINEQRRASITFPVANLFYNKGTSLMKEMFTKYIGWLSPDNLFFGGDSPSLYRFGEHGVLYLLDMFFIFLGLFGLTRLKGHKYKNGFIFLLIILFIVGPLPSAISKIGDSYFFRGFLIIPALIVLIAYGVTFFYQELDKKHKGVAIGVAGLLYLILFVNFLVFFFFRYSVKQQENHFLSGRVVSNYFLRVRETTNKSIIVITTSPYAMYHQYLIFSNGLEVNRPQLKSEEHVMDNIFFKSECDDYKEGDIVIFDSRLNCILPDDKNVLVIQDQKDAGFQFSILNDNLCKDYILSPWRREHFVSDYVLEKMDAGIFCNRWIYKYEN